MFRRRRARTRTRVITQSFKKVINYAPTSRIGATKIDFEMATGQDSVAAGQTGPVDVNVPTGSIIESIEIQYTIQNVLASAAFCHVAIQRVLPSQSSISPNVIGGSNQRNQVHWQRVFAVGTQQNVNIIKRFKIPRPYQRVREGARWVFVVLPSANVTDVVQVIYKFKR